MVHRFFVPAAWLQGDRAQVSGPLVHQWRRVLRLAPGDRVVLLDDSGWAYEVELDQLSADRAAGRVVARFRPQTEPRVSLVLCQALTREKKFDWVLQKGTELGVSTFVPLLTARSLIAHREAIDAGRLARWQRIVTEAAEQSGRARLPRVLPAVTLEQLCRTSSSPGTLALIASPAPEARPLSRVLRITSGAVPSAIHLVIGPEGGFTSEEIGQARQAGMEPISLGPRILRTETAGLVALAVVLYALGELDAPA